MRATQIASLSALIVSSVAHPHHQSSEHALQGRQVASGGNLERFRPQQRAEYVNATVVESDLTDPSSNSSIVARQGGYVAVAAALVRATHPDAEFRQLEDNHVSSSGVGHVYFKQTLFGFDIDDADFNVNVCQSSEHAISSIANTKPRFDRTVQSSRMVTRSTLDHFQVKHPRFHSCWSQQPLSLA